MLPRLNPIRTRAHLGSGSVMQSQGSRGKPLWLWVVLGGVGVMVFIFLLVLMTMGSAPTPEAVVQPLSGV